MYIVVGAILGLILFQTHESEFIGIVLGMILGWALSQRRRISVLETKVALLTNASLQKSAITSSPIKTETATTPIPAKEERVAGNLATEQASRTTQSQQDHSTVTAIPKISPRDQVTRPAPDNFIVNAIKSFFTSGNTIARVGVLVLFIGVAFLLKYVSDQGILSIEQKLIGTACAGLILLALGWRLRTSRKAFGLILQGGGFGIFYLTVFAAFKLYSLIPSVFALGLLLIAIVGASALAVLQDSKSLAVLSSIGGFLAPVLTSTGHGSHIALFSYYLALNAGILLIAWYKAWRELNLVGFIFTFGIGTLWGIAHYNSLFFNSVELFLILFFGVYFLTGLLFALKNSDRPNPIDGLLVFGLPCITVFLQARLVKDTEYGLAISTALLGALYVVTARELFRRYRNSLSLLLSSFIGIGLALLTLTIPYAFNGRVTSGIWALEGAVAVWFGVRDRKVLLRYFGLGLQITAGLFFIDSAVRLHDYIPILNPFFMGSTYVMVALLFSGYAYSKAKADKEVDSAEALELLLYLGGLIWWASCGALELNACADDLALMIVGLITGRETISAAFENASYVQLLTVFFAFIAGLAYLVGNKLKWRLLRRTYLALSPFVWISFLRLTELDINPIFALGGLMWPIVFATIFVILHYEEKLHESPAKWQHGLAAWLLVIVLSFTAKSIVQHHISAVDSWPNAAFDLCVATSVLVALTARFWPLRTQGEVYKTVVIPPLVGWLYLSSIYNNLVDSGAAAPLPYLPILNPLDITQLVTLIVALSWYIKARSSVTYMSGRTFGVLLGLASFVWLTALPVRTIHHYLGVPWDFDQLFESNIVQMTLSIFWCLVALTLMTFAVKRVWRVLWIGGASLLAVVVIKLLLVDLANSHTLERVISFIGSGVLLLIIGYLAPIPPRSQDIKNGQT